MNKNEFEHILKELSDDFRVPVSEGAFNQVMQRRQQQKKKRRVWFALFSVVIVAGLAGGAVFLLPESKPDGQTVASVTRAQAPDMKTTPRAHATPSTTRKPEEKVYTTAPRPLRSSENQVSQSSLHKASPLNFTIKKAAKEGPGKTGNKKGQDAALINGIKGTQGLPGKVEVMPADGMKGEPEKQETLAAHSGVVQAVADSSGLTAKTIDTASGFRAKIADTMSVPLLVTNDRDSQELATPAPGLEIKKSVLARRWMIGVYGDYTPVTTARNANSAIPFPHTDSLGLSDKAVYSFSTGVKVGYAIHDKVSLSIGFGYNKIQFEEVRFASVKVDSATFELVNNGATTKSKVVYPQNISDRSLSALQVPVGITYHTMLSKRIGFYAQAGVLYQYIFRSKGYEFTSSEDDNLSYREVTSKGLDRLNRNQFAWYAEPGLELLLSPRLRYQLGIVYRKHVTSLYNKEYLHLSAPAFMGFSTGLRFNF